MAMNLLPLGSLGAVENKSNGTVTFGIWLPWVSDSDGNSVCVKIIHENDQFLQKIPPQEFPLTHSVRDPYGDFWSATVPIAGTPPLTQGSAWGTPGRYLYRYRIDNPNVGSLDWIIDPCAREFGVGKLSAFTLELAKKIATRPAMGLRLAKLSVNQSLDAQGQWTAIQAAFSLHHLGHAHARALYGSPVEPSGFEQIRREAKQEKSKI